MSEGDQRDEQVWFGGEYRTWADAQAASNGYDSPIILDRVVAATRRVVAGEAAYERDSVTFDRIEHSPTLLAALLYAASRCGNRLDLVDFGGSLGSTYRQNRAFLARLSELRWSIVEQRHFVEAGRREFETDVIRFYGSLEECLERESVRVALLSSVLQYLPRPYETLAHVLEAGFDIVILDRTPFFVDDLLARITVEHVPEAIYPASYPSWFLNIGELRGFIAASGFEVLLDVESWESWNVDGDSARNRCLLVERRGS